MKLLAYIITLANYKFNYNSYTKITVRVAKSMIQYIIKAQNNRSILSNLLFL